LVYRIIADYGIIGQGELQIADYWRFRFGVEHKLSLVTVTKGRGWFGNPEEGKRPPLEAVTRGLVKRQQTENTKCMLYEL
jgi:hypothetical protein